MQAGLISIGILLVTVGGMLNVVSGSAVIYRVFGMVAVFTGAVLIGVAVGLKRSNDKIS